MRTKGNDESVRSESIMIISEAYGLGQIFFKFITLNLNYYTLCF